MSIRQRIWINRDGSQSEAWIANYTDLNGVRRLKTFAHKHEAEAYHNAVVVKKPRGGIFLIDPDDPAERIARVLWANLDRSKRELVCANLDRLRALSKKRAPNGRH